MIDITELAQMKGQKVEGSYYLAECTDCGKMYPSNKLNGGEPLFSGDYGECYCPHCNADDAAIGDCGDTAAIAWNYQQGRIDALVEALEKAQAKNALVAGGIEASTKLHERIGSLTSENAALKGSVENAAGCINAAYAEGLIDVLAESSDERLVDLVKRRLLHAYLPVETPATDDVLVAMGDAVLLEQLEYGGKAIISQSNIIGLQANRIAELESRIVTVKLPKPISVLHRREFTEAHCAIYAYPEAEVNAALDDSGIKWEAE